MSDESKYETVFLGGLPHCSREEIINLCGSTGRIASTRVRRGYAFIVEAQERRAYLLFARSDADFGIKHLHGIEFKGKKITAEFARRHVERKDTGRVNALKFSEPRRAFVVDLQTTTSDTVHVDPSLLIAARDPEITRLVPEAVTTTTDIMVPILAFPDPGLANSATATMTPWINPKLILRVPILASDLTMRGDDTILGPGLPLLMMMIPIQYHYIRHFHRILNMFQVGNIMLSPPKANLLKHDRSSYDDKYNQRSISPSYRNPLQRIYEDVDRGSAHLRGFTRSRDDSAQGHRNQTNRRRQTSDPDSVSDVNRYSGNYREERTTTAHRYYSRSPSPRLQASRRNAISGDHESYYSRDFFEASVPQSAYHY
ncbi:hypothetical protein EV359DRAFT_65914 [Lentinula novae-zelandiae]|nr:hypothetical protein EV359DRAFT_65914 [Lentinula novae-zelandiae]